jgi:spore maturation protein CgeB
VRWIACHPGPGFSVADVHVGYVEALRAAGEKVLDFPLGDALCFYDNTFMQVSDGMFRKAVSGEQATKLASDRLAGALYKVRPDVLLITSGFFVDPDLLALARRDGVRVVTIHTEEPYEHARELDLAGNADLALLTDPVNIDQFRQVTRAEFFGHCYRPHIHYPGQPDSVLACDFTFVGTGYPSRVALLEAMELDGLDVVLAGNWERLGPDSPLRRHVVAADCLDNADTATLYRSAKVGLNLYRREGESAAGWSMGPREVEMAACGLFFLRDPRPETDAVLSMLPAFAAPAEAGELLRWWLRHDEHRETAALKAREAIQDRTFDHTAARLLRLLERE